MGDGLLAQEDGLLLGLSPALGEHCAVPWNSSEPDDRPVAPPRLPLVGGHETGAGAKGYCLVGTVTESQGLTF